MTTEAIAQPASWTVTRVYYPADNYIHPPSGLVQLRVVRRGSSYAHIDLGLGIRQVFTRPGDLLVSLPHLGTSIRIDDGRELTLLQIESNYASNLIQRTGGASLDDLLPLLRRPVRDPLVAELVRRLEERDVLSEEVLEWKLGLIIHSLQRTARRLAERSARSVLSHRKLQVILDKVRQGIEEPWSVETLAAQAGVPRRAFAAAFKEALGMPVHQYILSMRVDRAIELLTSSDVPLADVALRTGFANQAHMSRVVNKLKGRTPGEIRAGS